MSFAVKCVEFSDAHWKLCGAIRPSTLRLTKYDAELLSSFKEDFPDLATKERLSQLNEQKDLKSPDAREAWRKWIAKWDKKIGVFFSSIVVYDA